MHKILLVAAAALAAATVSAGAAEGIIRGDAMSWVNPAPPEGGFGASAPTVLRGIQPAGRALAPSLPASNLGSDADGPLLDLPCLHTEPPTCR